MISIKHLLLAAVVCCSTVVFADEKAEIKKFVEAALLIDSWDLPNAGRLERVALIKKEQGKYLIYRAVSRKI